MNNDGKTMATAGINQVNPQWPKPAHVLLQRCRERTQKCNAFTLEFC